MELGASSIGLAVKNLEASRTFYEKFGFAVFAGNASQNWTPTAIRFSSIRTSEVRA